MESLTSGSHDNQPSWLMPTSNRQGLSLVRFIEGLNMSHEITEKLKNTRLARKAQINSGLNDEIRALQKQIVIQSFSTEFDSSKHRLMMNQLKQLKAEYKNIGALQSV